jgi:hypothetical protein
MLETKYSGQMSLLFQRYSGYFPTVSAPDNTKKPIRGQDNVFPRAIRDVSVRVMDCDNVWVVYMFMVIHNRESISILSRSPKSQTYRASWFVKKTIHSFKT